jgi:hypothetical protein
MHVKKIDHSAANLLLIRVHLSYADPFSTGMMARITLGTKCSVTVEVLL